MVNIPKDYSVKPIALNGSAHPVIIVNPFEHKKNVYVRKEETHCTRILYGKK